MRKSIEKSDTETEGRTRSISSVGSEIRQLRKARGLTLKELSDMAQVSPSYLSELERGLNSPSVEVLQVVAAALHVEVGWFFPRQTGSGPLEKESVVRLANRRSLNILYERSADEIGYFDYLLSSSIGTEICLGISYWPVGKSQDRPFTQYIGKGTHHGVVIEGQIELCLQDETIILSEGDSYSFDQSIRHRFRNVFQRQAVTVWATLPIILNIRV